MGDRTSGTFTPRQSQIESDEAWRCERTNKGKIGIVLHKKITEPRSVLL